MFESNLNRTKSNPIFKISLFQSEYEYFDLSINRINDVFLMMWFGISLSIIVFLSEVLTSMWNVITNDIVLK